MSEKKTLLLFGLIFYFLISCNSQNQFSSSGIIVTQINYFDAAKKRFVNSQAAWPNHKVLFKDSLVIHEIVGLYMDTDTNGIEKRRVSVMFYTFIDLRTKSFYDYTSFSDTARLIKKYTQPDSVNVAGGWNFYYPYSLSIQSYKPLADTVIDGIEYKRIKLVLNIQSKQSVSIGYLRCDKKGTMFQYDKDFSKKIGCPLVRLDETEGGNRTLLSRRIEFVSDKLTPEELKVFAAWEKNAKENPVQK